MLIVETLRGLTADDLVLALISGGGSALMALFEQKGWITRAPGYREVQVTDSGRAALSRLFNLKVSG